MAGQGGAPSTTTRLMLFVYDNACTPLLWLVARLQRPELEEWQQQDQMPEHEQGDEPPALEGG